MLMSNVNLESFTRFAQRVAMIKNDAILNEELDPRLMIAKLKREVQLLKDELSMMKGVEYEGKTIILLDNVNFATIHIHLSK